MIEKITEFEEAVTLASTPAEKVEAMNDLAFELIKSDPARVLTIASDALSLARTNGYKKGEAGALNMIGCAYQNISDYASAIEHFFKALAIYQEMDNTRSKASLLSNIGNIYSTTGDYPLALDYTLQSLRLNQEIGNTHGEANALMNAGRIYTSIRDYDRALEYLQKALDIFREMSDMQGVATTFNNLGGIYYHTGDSGKALESYTHACNIFHEIGYRIGESHALNNIGNMIYQSRENIESAIDHYMKALAIKQEIADKRGVAITIHNIGSVYSDKETTMYDPEKAIEHLAHALHIAAEIGAKPQMYNNHQGLAKVYEQAGDFSKAYEHFTKFHEIEKEVLSEEATKKISNLEQRRQMDLLQQEQRLTAGLLNKIFPRLVVDRLLHGESPLADYYPEATILFLDLVDFTALTTQIPPKHLLYLLNSIFDTCDAVISLYGLEKIKTIGDAYMAAAGVPEIQEDHAGRAAHAGVALLKALKELVINIPNDIEGDRSWLHKAAEIQVRIGLHCGEVIGGVIGQTKYIYDLWGDTVNTAARLQSTGKPNNIHVSEDLFKKLNDAFIFEERGKIEIKGKGMMQTYFLLKEK